MQQAIEIAKQTEQKGGVAIGALLVDDVTGEVVATGGSEVALQHDATAHAEIIAIRTASKKRGSDDLFGLILYSTLEPCHMCLSAAAWAKISHVFFGAYRKDVNEDLFDVVNGVGDEAEAHAMNLRENANMIVHGGIRERECAELLKHHGAEKPAHSS